MIRLSAAASTVSAQSRWVRPSFHVCRFRCQAFSPPCDLHVGKRAVQYSTFICILCAPLFLFSIQVCCWRLWDLSHLAFSFPFHVFQFRWLHGALSCMKERKKSWCYGTLVPSLVHELVLELMVVITWSILPLVLVCGLLPVAASGSSSLKLIVILFHVLAPIMLVLS